MATQRPISTISYNTESFLREHLEQWVDAHLIQSYMYIKHKGEDGDKDHIHLYIEPNKRLDAMELTNDLKEYEIGKTKPLAVRPWRQSKEEDWILYAVHDKEYMRIKYKDDKCEKIPYKWTDIVASEYFDIETAFLRAKANLEHTAASLLKQIREEGKRPSELVLSGENPFVVSQVMNLLKSNDYSNKVEENMALRDMLQNLTKQLYLLGLSVVWNDDNTCDIVQDPIEEE